MQWALGLITEFAIGAVLWTGRRVFKGASEFNQGIGSWKVNENANKTDMLIGTNLSPENKESWNGAQ